MAKQGRTPKLDEVKRGQIIDVVRLGGSTATAAAAVGCSARTVYNTAERDRKFAERLREARAMHEMTLIKRIGDAACDAKYWRAAAWMLERLDPDRFARFHPRPYRQK
jgi:hypothetical protein